jgi:hypothetical protein
MGSLWYSYHRPTGQKLFGSKHNTKSRYLLKKYQTSL